MSPSAPIAVRGTSPPPVPRERKTPGVGAPGAEENSADRHQQFTVPASLCQRSVHIAIATLYRPRSRLGSFGAVVVAGSATWEAARFLGLTHPLRAELLAVCHVIEHCPAAGPIVLWSDSRWLARVLIYPRPEPAGTFNADLLARLSELRQGRRIEIRRATRQNLDVAQAELLAQLALDAGVREARESGGGAA